MSADDAAERFLPARAASAFEATILEPLQAATAEDPGPE